MLDQIILHIGATKTGTTAIQTALAYSHRSLAKNGIWYPLLPRHRQAAERQEAVQGNGKLIFFPQGRQYLPSKARDRIHAHLGAAMRNTDNSRCVISSEMLMDISPEQISSLREELAPFAKQIRIVLFIRNLVDHTLSQYGEHVRRRREKLSFEDYAGIFENNFRRTYQAYADIFGASSVEVYSTVGLDNAQEFFFKDVLDSTVQPINGRFNRSLCLEELELIRALPKSKKYDRLTVLEFAKSIERRPAVSKRRLTATPKAVEILKDRYGMDVDFMNGVMQPGHSISLVSPKLVSELDPQKEDLVTKVEIEAAKQACAKIVAARQEAALS